VNGGTKDIFIKECEDNNIGIDKEKIVPYVCYWYDGTDSYMSTTTLEEFLENFVDKT